MDGSIDKMEEKRIYCELNYSIAWKVNSKCFPKGSFNPSTDSWCFVGSNSRPSSKNYENDTSSEI